MSVNTSWANRSKAALAATAPTQGFRAVKVGNGNSAGGGDIAKYLFVYTPEKMTDRKLILKPGDTVEGTYVGSMKDNYNEKHPLHKILTKDGIYVLPQVARIQKAFAGAEVGGEVRITYNGKNEIESGPGAGKSAHSFTIE